MLCRDLRFLVVEDHEFQSRCLTQLLTSLGAGSIHAAEDGRSALRQIADSDHPFDIVICDVTMPGMDGMEFIRRWSERADPTSLILVSAIEPDLLASVAHMALAYNARLLGVTAKPATAAKLTPLLALHRSRMPLQTADGGFPFPELMQAWTGGEFECWFVPQVNLATGALRSMSTVPRWRHPVRGVLGPESFMASVQARGLGDDVAWLLLQQAAAQCRRWERQGDGLPVSVPLSFLSLGDIQLAPHIQQVVQREGLDPRALVLAVDESALGSDDLGRVLETLARLRLMGFGLAIEGFGNGAMEVDRLSLAAFTELRIGSALVTGDDGSGPAQAGLAVALQAAHRLQAKVVATGVGSKEAWNMLHRWGCRFGEGPFIAPPMAGAAVAPWLTYWRERQRKTA